MGKREHNRKTLIGQSFGHLIVVGEAVTKNGRYYWPCRCVCGREISVRSDALIRNKQVSCGCVSREKARERATTHGKAGSRIYKIYRGMLDRCNNPNHPSYPRYGGKGIKVEDSNWSTFVGFISDMGEPPTDKHTLDRKNNLLGYSKSNCRWATMKEQALNRTNNHVIEKNGEVFTISEWSERLNIPDTTIHSRLSNGYSEQEAIKNGTLARQHLLSFDGKTLTLAEWSSLIGVPYETLRHRVSYLGWSVERALTTPLRPKKSARMPEDTWV